MCRDDTEHLWIRLKGVEHVRTPKAYWYPCRCANCHANALVLGKWFTLAKSRRQGQDVSPVELGLCVMSDETYIEFAGPIKGR